MNATPEQQKRVALAIKPDAAHVIWVALDQTGQPPRVIDDMIRPRLELISLDDSPIAIYRADTDESYTRDALAALAELVRVVNGMPNVSADVDEQMRQLREQLRATVENATETFNKYEARIARDEHRIERIIEQARYWKQRAQQRKIYVEHYQEQERTLRAEISALEDNLRVARNAVERAVNRSNHSNEYVDRARLEAASLRQQLGQATAEAHDLRERIATVQANALDTINRVAAALPGPVVDAEIVEPPFEIVSFYSADGDVPIVEISTTAISGRVRVNLNDGVIWDGDPESDERPGAWAEPLPWETIATRNERELTTMIVEQTATVNEGTEKIEELTAIISRQLDTIHDQAERIEELQDALQRHVDSSHEVRTADFTEMRRALEAPEPSDPIRAARQLVEAHKTLQAERDELVQALKNRNGEGDPADPGAHGGTIPRYGMLDLWMALHGSESSTEFEEFYDRVGYADAWSELLGAVRSVRQQRDTHRRDAAELRGELNATKTISDQAATSFDKAKAEMLDEIRTLRVERDNARADAEKLREINETQRSGIDAALAEAKHLREQRDAASSRGLKIEARFDSVLAKPAQIDAALRIIACGKLTLQDARALVPTDTDPLGVAYAEKCRVEALQQRDDLDRKLTESETMRKRLDEQLATERRVYGTASAALRAMLRERDAVLDVAERAAYPTAHGVSAMVAIGEFRAARDRLPKLEPEADARKDESIRKMIAAVDQAVRFWRHSPANVMTEQLNIALSNLAESIQPNS